MQKSIMEQFHFPYQQSLKSQLPEQIQALVDAAETAAANTDPGRPKLTVGAALLTENENVITASSQVNAINPEGVCAERAVLYALNNHNEREKIKSIAITYVGKVSNEKPIAPCGACRQALLETQIAQDSPISIYMCSPDGRTIMIADAGFLLPFAFIQQEGPVSATAVEE